MVRFDIRQLYTNKSQIGNCANNIRFVCEKEDHQRQDKHDSLRKTLVLRQG